MVKWGKKSSSDSQSICLVLSRYQNLTYTVNSPNNPWKIHVKGRVPGEDSQFVSDDENRKVVLVRFQGCGLRKTLRSSKVMKKVGFSSLPSSELMVCGTQHF